MIQITNANIAQRLVLKLDGYSATSTADRVLIYFTNQLTGKQTVFSNIAPSSTNGRYQSILITPPSGTDRMVEGLYLVGVFNANASVQYAERLAFVSGVTPFGEATYTAYTEGDSTAYNVYTQ